MLNALTSSLASFVHTLQACLRTHWLSRFGRKIRSGPTNTAFRDLVNGIQEDALILLDPQGRIVLWNEGAVRLHSFTPQEVEGVSLAFFFSHHDLISARIENLRKEAMQSGRAECETWIYRRDGTRFWARIYLNSLHDHDQKLSGFAGVIRDLSTQREIETALREAKDAAEAANQAKASFLANISHEIRTPLGAILGFSEILMECPEITEDEKSQHIASIQRNALVLSKLINDVLDISKVEANKLTFERVEITISDLIHDLEQFSHAEIKSRQKPVVFLAEASSRVPLKVMTDPVRLRQILYNVIGNAIKFTEKGRVEVWIDVAEDKLLFSVKDTGIGLSHDQQLRLFQPFTQAEESTSRRFGGTGLGLFLGRQLARRMGGDLVLSRSQVNRGCEFTISVQLEIPRGALAKLEPRIATTQRPILKGKKVLVVEDSADNRLLIQSFLTRADAKVFCAKDGCEGVAMALKNTYDIVLMDVRMPNLDGIQATQKLRQLNYQKPILAVTAHALKDEVERCLAAGYTDHISKPISSRELLEKVAWYTHSYPGFKSQ